jgi:3-phenylpropionate/trans-cinnamate dioxygenase ferredoxin subunit
MATFMKVATIDELPSGVAKLVEVNQKRIALFNVGGRCYAIDDTCPHRGAPLSEGDVEGETVVCPWHGAIFELATGEVKRYPASVGVTTYEVRLEDGAISIAI